MLHVTRTDAVAVVTLASPERRNALSLELMLRLIGEFEAIASSPDIRAVILAAEGPVFSSGHDLTEMRGRNRADYGRLFDACTRLMLLLQDLPQPVIAEVQGVATAAGCQLAAACDLLVAGEDARFAAPGVRIGLFCSTPAVPLMRAIGRKRAMEMLLTGEPIDARQALAWGLANRVVPAERLREESLSLARKITEASGATVSAGKRAFYRQAGVADSVAYECAQDAMTENSLTADAQEGIGAFLEKRVPRWVGR